MADRVASYCSNLSAILPATEQAVFYCFRLVVYEQGQYSAGEVLTILLTLDI